MSLESAARNYARKYGESYPGEAEESVADAMNEAFDAAVDSRTADMAQLFADSPSSILSGNPDFDCETVKVLVRHILELRQFVPIGYLARLIARFRDDLAGAKQIEEWARDDVERGEA